MTTVKKMKEYPLDQVHRLMEPGPVIMVTTSRNGEPNVMTNGFNMMVRHAPPVIAAMIGPWDYSFGALRETGQCVISIPTVELATTVVDIGNRSGQDTDKFADFGLTTVDAARVGAPLIAECFANIECEVAEFLAAYNLFILEAVRAWVRPSRDDPKIFHHRGDGTFTVDGDVLDLTSHMTKWQELL